MSRDLLRAARCYIERLDFRLVVADADKVPLTRFFPHGVLSATTNLGLIRRAIESTRGATLAARVGRHLVLDVDVRHGGPEALAKLIEHSGPLPETWTQRTPSGGQHIWFQPIPLREAKGHLCKGVEAKRGNQLVTLSPTTRADGRYEWTRHPLRGVPLASAPQWIVNALEVPPVPTRTRATEIDPDVRLERARRYLERVDPAISGQGGHAHTFRVATVITRGFDLDEKAAFQLLEEWNRNCCAPPWSARELRHKVRSALRRGRMEFGAKLERSAP